MVLPLVGLLSEVREARLSRRGQGRAGAAVDAVLGRFHPRLLLIFDHAGILFVAGLPGLCAAAWLRHGGRLVVDAQGRKSCCRRRDTGASGHRIHPRQCVDATCAR